MKRIKYVLKNLFENKQRFLLTALSIAVGVTSVLIIESVSDYCMASVTNELDSLGLNGLIVTKEADTNKLTESDVQAAMKIDGITQIAPVTINTAKVFTNRLKSSTAMVWGIDERSQNVVSLDLLYGRLINHDDIVNCKHVCVLDCSLAEELFGSDDIIGENLGLISKKKALSFEVVGVVKTGNSMMQSVMGSYFPSFLYAPYTAFEKNSGYDRLFLKLNSDTPSDDIAFSLKKTFGSSFKITDLSSQKETLEKMLCTIKLVLTVIGSVSLIVSGLGIMNIMLISVNQRIREIGIKKAIGASNSEIMLDFLCESVVISFVGSLLGIIISIIIIYTSSQIAGYKIYIKLNRILTLLVFTVILGIIFGMIPACKASKLKPVEALRR